MGKTDPDGGDPSPAVDADRAHGHPGRRGGARPPGLRPARPARPLRRPAHRRAGAGRQPPRRGGRRLRGRPGTARPRPHPPRDARSRCGGAGAGDDGRAGPSSGSPSAGRSPSRASCASGSPSPGSSSSRPGRCATTRRTWSTTPGQQGGPAPDRGREGRRAAGGALGDRPGDPGARRCRDHRRHAARRCCTAGTGRCGSSTDPTRCTSRRWLVRSCLAHRYSIFRKGSSASSLRPGLASSGGVRRDESGHLPEGSPRRRGRRRPRARARARGARGPRMRDLRLGPARPSSLPTRWPTTRPPRGTTR